jgi:hypothetical protein
MISQELSYLAPRDVRPFNMNKNRIPDLQLLQKLGIGLDSVDVNKMMEGLGMDSGIQGFLTTPSVGTPVQFLQAWLPGFVAYLTAAQMIDEIAGISVVGRWEDEEVVQGMIERVGVAIPYGDYTPVKFASYNNMWERRTIVRFEEGFRIGILEEKRAGAARINAAGEKRESAALALEIQRNNIGFYGYNATNVRTYGFLNDPNLPAYITVAAGGEAGNPTVWSSKTFQEITADIRTGAVQLQTQSQGRINPFKSKVGGTTTTSRLTLVLPTNVAGRLSVTTDFGMSVIKWIDDTFTDLRIVTAPELNGANGGSNVFYMYADSLPGMGSTDDGRTFTQMVQTKVMTLGVERAAKWYAEDFSNATAGVMCKRPFAVVRYSGI